MTSTARSDSLSVPREIHSMSYCIGFGYRGPIAYSDSHVCQVLLLGIDGPKLYSTLINEMDLLPVWSLNVVSQVEANVTVVYQCITK